MERRNADFLSSLRKLEYLNITFPVQEKQISLLSNLKTFETRWKVGLSKETLSFLPFLLEGNWSWDDDKPLERAYLKLVG